MQRCSQLLLFSALSLCLYCKGTSASRALLQTETGIDGVQVIQTGPVLVEPAPAGDPVITVLPRTNVLEDLLLTKEELPPPVPSPETEAAGSVQFREDDSADAFFGEVDPQSFCRCTDTIPREVFSCQEIRFKNACESERIWRNETFCQITCGRCHCCPNLLTMASRRGLDIFRIAAERLLELEGPRSVANLLADPTFAGTVLIPTNDAFGRFFMLLNITKEGFLNQPRLLNQIITYHVLVGTILPTIQELLDGVWGRSLLTQNAASFLALETNGDSLVLQGIGSRTQILIPDLHSCRGLIHVVEDLLVPFSTSGYWE